MRIDAGDRPLTPEDVREALGNLRNRGALGRSRVAHPSILCALSDLTPQGWRRMGRVSRGGKLAIALETLLTERIHDQAAPEWAAYYGLLWMRYVAPRGRRKTRVTLEKGAAVTEEALPRQGYRSASEGVVDYMVNRFGALGASVFTEELRRAEEILTTELADMEQKYLLGHPEVETLPLKRAFVPPLLKKNVARQLLQEVITVATARKADGRPLWQGVILYGMAGTGKTELAKALAYQEEIADSFDGGVFWIDASRGEAKEWAERLCGALGEERKRNEDWLACWHRSAERQRLLLIVDDVTDAGKLVDLLARLGPWAVVVVTTQDRGRAWTEMARWITVDAVRGIPVRGMAAEEGRRLVEAVLEQELEGDWAVVQQIGEVVGWHAEEMFAAALESRESDWGTTLKLAASGLLSERWFNRQWGRMTHKERQRLTSLVRWMKGNGPFGPSYGAVVWDMDLGDVERWLRRFEGMGLIQEMEAQRGILRPTDPLWQVTQRVYEVLRPEEPDRVIERAREAMRRYQVTRRVEGLCEQGEPLYKAPPIFRLVETLHWLAVIVKIVVAFPLKVIGWATGRWSLYRRWMDRNILLRVETRLKAIWLEAGIEPTQEFWLIYDSKDVVAGALFLFELLGLIGIGAWLFANISEDVPTGFLQGFLSKWGNWIAALWMFTSFFLIVWQVTWRVWMAHLYGVETRNLSHVLSIARFLGMKDPREGLDAEG